jgi:hypothetical protein
MNPLPGRIAAYTCSHPEKIEDHRAEVAVHAPGRPLETSLVPVGKRVAQVVDGHGDVPAVEARVEASQESAHGEHDRPGEGPDQKGQD